MKYERWVQDFLVLPQVRKSFPSVVSRARRCDLVHVECFRWLGQWWLFLFRWRLMLLSVIAVRFKNTGPVSGKWNVSRVVPRLYGFRSWCYSKIRGRRVSPRFHPIRKQGEFEIPFYNPSGGKFLLRPSSSYNKLLGRVAFRILSNIPLKIHDGALLRK